MGGEARHDTGAEALRKADRLLDELGRVRRELEREESKLNAEVAAVEMKYAARIWSLQDRAGTLETILKALLKKHKSEIFGALAAGDSPEDVKINIEHGSVTRSVSSRVKRVKKFAEKLLELGRHELLGQAPPPPVKWDLVEKLPDAELKKLGTERVTETIYKFEVAAG